MGLCGPAHYRAMTEQVFRMNLVAHLVFASSASRNVVDLLVLAADIAEALRFRGSRGG